MNSTERQTNTPAMTPIMTAPTVLTKPEGAVMATKPANSPLPDMEASGFLYRSHMYNMAPKLPAIPASMVFTAMEPMRRLPFPDAPNVEPGLNPNQPNARIKQPSRTSTMSWPGMATGLPSRVNFPMRGPSIIARANAPSPPTACTTPEPAKSQ